MITIFNRKELVSTFDMKVQAEVREILAANQIDYRVETVNMGSSPHALIGKAGEKSGLKCEYRIFVKKSDFEKAGFVIRR